MPSLFSRSGRTIAAVAILACAGSATSATQNVGAPQDRARAEKRASDRIRTLLREADALAAQQSRLLTELKQLEADRQARAADVVRVERDLAETEKQLNATAQRANALRRTAEAERPDVETRLVHLYKLGSGGYWRMLLDVDDLRTLGRAYRNAAALNTIDRARVLAHQRTLQALAKEQEDLQARAWKLEQLHADARRARTAMDRAVRAHSALVDSIDARRDLNAQMSSELQTAQQRLQASMDAADGNGTPPVNLPV